MNHMPAAPHMPQNYRNQPPPPPPPRRHNDYHYANPNHHSHHAHQHVPLPQHPGPPLQPHHMPYHPYPHPQQFHHLPPPNYQQFNQQWYQPYQHYPSPHTPPTRPFLHHHHQPQQPPQQLQPQQPPLIVSSHPAAQAAPSMVNRSAQPPTLPANPTPQAAPTPQPEISTPSTTSQNIASSSTTPTTASAAISTPSVSVVKASASPAQQSPPHTNLAPPPSPAKRIPYYPNLPWLSVPEEEFPPRAPRRRRRRKPATDIPSEVELPSRTQHEADAPVDPSASSAVAPTTEAKSSSVSTTTPDLASTGQSTPSSAQPTSAAPVPAPTVTESTHTHKRTTTKPVVPAVPIFPINRGFNRSSITSPQLQAHQTSTSPVPSKPDDTIPPIDDTTPVASPAVEVRVPPKSWAELLRSQKSASNVVPGVSAASGSVAINGSSSSATSSLADVLRLYSVGSGSKICFLEPRGLVNTGNMCYMNSILQVLVFCVPFYDFLDQVAKRMVHNFKTDTPLIEAMIMFMREYPVIDSTHSVEQLRMRLKDSELEQYGDPFIPEYVYDVIRRLPRFSSMRRGQQHDAEEFLGFLFEGLHDECVHIMKGSSAETAVHNSSTSPTVEKPESIASADSEWMEVGPKQKAAVTRSSGADQVESPLTKIFGGKFRSVFRVPGLKDSVTLDPFQRIQLDIGDPAVSNITDALKGLARAETIHGEFNSPRGPGTPATKFFYIETLPPVLIIHLKRFQYDNAGATTQKIWKKVGYPLDLEIPKEAFPQHQRATLSMRPGGLPKYRLISVVYHHGKSAGGGHYTVDVRRQEGREWIRIDDTLIRRVRTEDVGSEGGEEDPKILAKALEQHKREQEAGGKDNLYKHIGFGGLNNEESVDGDNDNDDNNNKSGWSQVNGYSSSSPTATTASSKKWANIANGDITPKSGENPSGKQTPKGGATNKFSAKDNKVAYILFYQQIHP